MSFSSSTSSAGPLPLGSGIVAALNRYGQVSVPFLAKVLGRRPSELEDYLQPLQRDGVIVRDENQVKLADSH